MIKTFVENTVELDMSSHSDRLHVTKTQKNYLINIYLHVVININKKTGGTKDRAHRFQTWKISKRGKGNFITDETIVLIIV